MNARALRPFRVVSCPWLALRPLLLQASWVGAWLALLLFLVLPARPADAQSTPLGCPSAEELAAVALINDARQQLGLSVLKVDRRLVQAAQLHSHDMAQHGFVGGVGTNGALFVQRMLYFDYGFLGGGQSVGQAPTAAAMVASWAAGPGSQALLLSPQHDEVGVGCVPDVAGALCYWTVVYGDGFQPTQPPPAGCPAVVVEPDCDANGIPDPAQLWALLSTDLDASGQPDACDSFSTCPTFEAHSLLELVQDQRLAAGLAPLAVDDRLVTAAWHHGFDMAASGNLSHTGSDGSSPAERALAHGYGGPIAGELIAAGSSDPAGVLGGWQGPDDLAILLSPSAQHVGVAHLDLPGTPEQHFWTVLVGSGGGPGQPLAADCATVPFARGDCNGDGSLDIADAVGILTQLFPVGPPPAQPCPDACDANDDEINDIADAIAVFNALFGSQPLPAPHPGCGLDAPGGLSLTCSDSPGC